MKHSVKMMNVVIKPISFEKTDRKFTIKHIQVWQMEEENYDEDFQ